MATFRLSPIRLRPFGFAGEYQDKETGLYYLRARYYDPRTGAFLTRDPLEPITATPYAYAANDPINLVDPLGLAPWDWAVDVAQGATDFVVRNQHTIIDIATTAAVGVAAAGCTATVVCAVGVGAAGFAAHLGSDALLDDCNDIDPWDALTRSAVSTTLGYVGATAASPRAGWNSFLFGRGGNPAITNSTFKGILNRGPVRIGRGWNENALKKTVFRMGIGSGRHIDLLARRWWP